MITIDPDVFAETMSKKIGACPALYSIQYALTYRCNVACVHCYVEGADRGAPPELTVAEVDDLFGQFAALGCLHCTVTGGEPLVRADFEPLWLAIAQHGIRRLLFTNATLADDRKAAFLREVPPDWVEVTVYGANAATHDAVTRVPGSFDATFGGIRRLEQAGLRVRLKTVVMRSNVGQLAAIRQLAQSVGDGSFRLDGQLMGTFAGEIDIDALRVPPAELAAAELAHGNDLLDAWCHELERLDGHERKGLYACGAAQRSAYLSPWGDLHPCLCAAHIAFPLRRMPVREAWDRVRSEVCGKPFPADHVCRNCEATAFCQSCPAVAQLDAGDESGRSSYRCAVAMARRMLYYALHD